MNQPKSTDTTANAQVVEFRRASAEEQALRDDVEELRAKLEALRAEVASLRRLVKDGR